MLLLSGGSRRAPTPASTSTRLASPSRYCDDGNVFSVHLRLNLFHAGASHRGEGGLPEEGQSSDAPSRSCWTPPWWPCPGRPWHLVGLCWPGPWTVLCWPCSSRPPCPTSLCWRKANTGRVVSRLGREGLQEEGLWENTYGPRSCRPCCWKWTLFWTVHCRPICRTGGKTTLMMMFFQLAAQVESGQVDAGLVEHLHHAKRLFPSSSPTNVQLNLHSGSVDTRLPRSPSTGSRRPPTVVFTSTRLASTTW